MSEGDRSGQESTGIPNQDRRPLPSRSTGWAEAASAALAGSRSTPNQFSIASIGFAAIGASAMLSNSPLGYLGAALAIQARLLCNLFDGMVAIEGGKQ